TSRPPFRPRWRPRPRQRSKTRSTTSMGTSSTLAHLFAERGVPDPAHGAPSRQILCKLSCSRAGILIVGHIVVLQGEGSDLTVSPTVTAAVRGPFQELLVHRRAAFAV